MSAHYIDDNVTVHLGDCLDVLRTLPDNSVDAVVTDPPAGISFMSKSWDGDKGGREQWSAWLADIMREALRVTKPGGHAFVWALPRTAHWTACGLEDAGWEIRDRVVHLFGTGFPKSKNLGNGFGTALKPAAEDWLLCRKPTEGSTTANFLAYGTGALNIDGTRVGSGGQLKWEKPRDMGYHGGTDSGTVAATENIQGRWPANVLLDGDMADALDEQSGIKKDSDPRRANGTVSGSRQQAFGMGERVAAGYGGEGGASRFFPTFRYQAKAPTRERPSYVKEGAGTGRVTGLGGKVRQCNVCETRAIESGASEPSCGHGDFRWEQPTTDTGSKVAHPTVKPLELMRWLVRLVTPPGGVVLEPFAGSGTTVEAALLEGFRCVAVEREADYLPLIVERIRRCHTSTPEPDTIPGDVPLFEEPAKGRWPTNVVMDRSQADVLDEQSGTSKSSRHTRGQGLTGDTYGQPGSPTDPLRGVSDEGGASRFFPVFDGQSGCSCGHAPAEHDEHGCLVDVSSNRRAYRRCHQLDDALTLWEEDPPA